MSAYESGQTLGRYRIVRPLGMGAMGRVYLAEDPRIERLLAIKTVRVEGGHTEVEERKRRLLREAKAAGKLSHHHIVTLYDAGEDGDTLFLAFEYVKGSDLAARLEAGPPLSVGEALAAVRQAAEGLDYAHQQGIVHRDIKPSNLMVEERGWVKVSDFGIAKLAGQSTELTMTGSVVGSPHYLSPEQIRGEELDGRSDLFSLGVVLYELLGGKRPFDADTLTALIYQILHIEPPPPLPPGEPLAGLNALVRRMMAKEREERFQRASEVVSEIAVLERELPPAVLASPAAKALAPADEKPTLAAASAAPPAAPAAAAAAAARPAMPAAAGSTPRPRGSRLPIVIGGGLAAVLVAAVVAGVFAWRALAPALLGRRAGTEVAEAESQAVPPRAAATPEGSGAAIPPAGSLPAERPEAGRGAPSPDPARASGGESAPGAVEGSGREPARQSEPRSTTPVRPETVAPPPEPSTVAEQPRTGAGQPASDAAVPPGASPGAALSPPASSAPAPPALRYDREITTGMTLRFAADPADAFVLVDGRVVGKANELSAQGGYTLPDPGDHLVVLRRDGRQEARLLVKASAGGGASTVPVRLPFLDASSSDLGDLELVRVREAIGFKVEPKTARVLVNGADRGQASEYGGLGRGWLKLPPGRHRVSLVAPGHRRVDLAVDVSGGAAEQRETIRLKLPPEGG